jgi:cytochrome c biogenesis protein CcmG, thiol:disulfide interchange protein DsbE
VIFILRGKNIYELAAIISNLKILTLLMNCKFYLLTTLSLVLCQFTFGQTKYIQTNEGKIVDTVAYALMKNDQIEKTKRAFQGKDIKVTIKENLKEIRKTNDSLIYTYKWEIKIGDPKVKEAKSFDPDDYIDKEFPLPALTTLDKKEISINDLKGKPTLINFWFTTCKPCIEEMPALSKIKNELKDSVNLIAITFETTDKVKKFFKKHNFNFTQVVNAEKFIDSLYMTAFPVNIFLDKNGIVKRVESGIPQIATFDENKKLKLTNGDEKEFIKVLRELL